MLCNALFLLAALHLPPLTSVWWVAHCSKTRKPMKLITYKCPTTTLLRTHTLIHTLPLHHCASKHCFESYLRSLSGNQAKSSLECFSTHMPGTTRSRHFSTGLGCSVIAVLSSCKKPKCPTLKARTSLSLSKSPTTCRASGTALMPWGTLN